MQKYNVELFVNYIRRSDPSGKNKNAFRYFEKSTVKGVCWYNKGLLHSCTHFLDLCDYWLGSLKIKLISKKKTCKMIIVLIFLQSLKMVK